MRPSRTTLVVHGIEMDVVYKDVKNVNIRITPPLGRVRVSAPRRLDEERVRRVVVERLAWIRAHQQRVQAAAQHAPRRLVTGESVDVWGRRCHLIVTERPGRPRVTLDGDCLHLSVPEGATYETRLRVLQQWQRAELRARLDVLLPTWEAVVGHPVSFYGIRTMKTRWGSCNPARGRVWFNLELATKHPRCLEYVVVHELAHFLECNHSRRFWAHLDRLLPSWREARDELRASPPPDEV